jgi:hypothetical protein
VLVSSFVLCASDFQATFVFFNLGSRNLARIFSILAIVAVLFLAANFLVGLTAGDFNAAALHKRQTQNRVIKLERQLRSRHAAESADLAKAKEEAAAADTEFRTPRARMTLHMMLGAAAALLTMLVNSITITYFVGTSRWCKEVCETYGFRPELAEHSARLKRNAFRWALAGIFSVIAIVLLGSAADPSGANWQRAASLVMPHYLAAMLGVVVVITSFLVQVSRIAENHAVIDEVVGEVQRLRTEQNLPAESLTP